MKIHGNLGGAQVQIHMEPSWNPEPMHVATAMWAHCAWSTYIWTFARHGLCWLAGSITLAGWVNFMLLKIGLYKSTIWLFHIAMERSTIFLIGKPSISIRAIYTMAMLVITRGYICNLPTIILWGSHGWCGPIRRAWSAVGFCAFSRHNIAIE